MSISAQPVPNAFPGHEGRRTARVSILVAATLRVGSQALAVRIRNMSFDGALIEGAVLPLPDTRVELLRGDLRASGVVAWVDGNRCGVRLDHRIVVDSWISGKATTHQALVDRRIDEARRAMAAAPTEPGVVEPGVVEPVSRIGPPDVAVAAEIDLIIAALASLGERLTDDPEVVARHGVQLQALDEAQQRLVAVKRRLA